MLNRGGGLGLVLASAGFGMLTAPIMELHNQKGYFLHHVIFACCTLICIICILLLPETQNRPLPETLADGESYARQPLLPTRKPGEQRSLLIKSESREYARVGDTPLHEAAATAISTMDSTASSAVDLPTLHEAPGPLQFMRMRKLASTQEQDEIRQTIDEYPASVITLVSSAPSVKDPLLGCIPNTSTPIIIGSIRASKIESPPDVILDVLPSSTVDTPLITDPVLESLTPTASTANVLSSSTEVLPPAFLDVGIPPIAQTPVPVANDSDFQAEMDSSGLLLDSPLPSLVSDSNIQLAVDSSDTPINDIIPLCNTNVTDALPLSTGQLPTQPSSSDSPVHLVNDIPPSPPTELSLDSQSDPSSQIHHIPAESLSSPIDSGIPILLSVAPSAMDSIESGPSSPAVLESSATINDGASLLATADSSTAHAISTDSVTDSGIPMIMELTASSPIDSGVPSALDLTTTETSNTANEVSSS